MPDSKGSHVHNSPDQFQHFIDDLLDLPLADLRQRWLAAHPETTLPKRMSRDLLVRSIAWQRQTGMHGGLGKQAHKQLDKLAQQLARSGTLEMEREVRLKPGTRLVREWQDHTYRVEVTDKGFAYDGGLYASLSHVARVITGTRWSGPRFFGLRRQDSNGHAE